ncbi:hypothetical protein vseg_018241 [Gypsophila vaccaria]
MLNPTKLKLKLKPPHLHLLKPYTTSTTSTTTTSTEHKHWAGLQEWRSSPINNNRYWGPTGPQPPSSNNPPPYSALSFSSLSEIAALVLSTTDPVSKAHVSHFGYSHWASHNLPIGLFYPPSHPARPAKPELVSPRDIPAPKDSGLPLNAYYLHNLAHVELNAIDLAWDTVVRFSPYIDILGEAFFADFAHVADDESRHFLWCSQRLSELGFSYGDMPAHNLLWRECEKSSDNVAARLATIPLVQEARGLDAGPRLVERMTGFGDIRTSGIVSRIAEEEVAHVAVGVYWFVSVCQKMGRVPCSTFKDLLEEYDLILKGPFNHSARSEAGLPRHWYDPAYIDNQNKEQLSEVYDRLAHVIAMETENASSSSPPP